MHKAPHEGSRRENDGLRTNFHLQRSLNPLHLVILNEDLGDIALMQINPLRPLDEMFHAKLIRLFVTLGSGGPNRWPLGRIQHAPLNGRCIGIHRHRTSQRIDFPNHVTFSQAPNCRVAAHLSDGV